MTTDHHAVVPSCRIGLDVIISAGSLVSSRSFGYSHVIGSWGEMPRDAAQPSF